MRMSVTFGAHPHEQYNSQRMLPVNRRKRIRLAIERHLCAQRGGKARDQGEVVVVSCGVSLDAGEELFVESRWLHLFPQQ